MSAPAKVRRVALVRPDDPAYLAAMSAQALAHRRLGPRQDPGDIYRASGLVEAAVRGWLGQRVPLLAERVLDVELLPAGGRAYERRFIELDAVEGRDGRPGRIVEAKFSANQGAVRRGLQQLGRARSLLGRRWDGVAALLVLVAANREGVAIDPERFRGLRVIEPDELEAPAGRDTPLLLLALDDLAGHLSARELQAIERGRDEGDQLTARRRERAGEEAEARSPSPAGPPGQAAASGTFVEGPDETPESPFAGLRGFVPRGGASGATDPSGT